MAEISVEIIPTREGVFDGIYRPWPVLKNAARWFVGKPVTVDHPQGGVNAGTFFAGQIVAVDIDDETHSVKCKAVLFPEMLPEIIQQKIDNKEPLEVSVGFFNVLVDEQGDFEGKEYQAVEKSIYIDHVAIVTAGACGLNDGCKLIAHSCKKRGENMTDNKGGSEETQQKIIYRVPKLSVAAAAEGVETVDFAEFESETDAMTALKNAYAQLKSMIDELQQKIQELEAKVAEMEAQKAEAEKTAEEAKMQKEEAEAEKQRVETMAREQMLSTLKPLGLSEDELKVYSGLQIHELRQIVTHFQKVAGQSKTPVTVSVDLGSAKKPDVEQLMKEFDRRLGK